MTELERLWIRNMVKESRTVVLLERKGEAALYESWRTLEIRNRMYNLDVYFHVWAGREHRVFRSVQEAQKFFNQRQKTEEEA